MAQFQPGQSGNPGGRPKQDSEVVAAAKLHTTKAVQTLADIMGSEAPPAARVAAAVALLDRAWGKPKQMIEGPGDDGEHIISTITRRLIPASAPRTGN